jgi:prophage regulatory protein
MFDHGQLGPLEFNMASIHETGFLRLNQIIGNKKSNPVIQPIIPVGKSTWWEGVKTGRFPQPVKFGPRITAWRVEDIRKLIEQSGFEE